MDTQWKALADRLPKQPSSDLVQDIMSAVYDDGLYGTIVEVTSGDMVYRYCGLAHDTDVKTGDTVKSGSRLGSIGKVSAEASLPTHLHFEVLRGGAYQDPMATLAG